MDEKQFERFKNKVGIDQNGCWVWPDLNWAGYGRFYINGKKRAAHRISYMHFKGPIPDGLEIDHLCRNPACVNPDHLEVVTRMENLKRGNCLTHGGMLRYWKRYKASGRKRTYRTGRASGQKGTHCKKGHPFAGENLRIIKSSGKQRCRTCHREYWRRWKKKRRNLGP